MHPPLSLRPRLGENTASGFHAPPDSSSMSRSIIVRRSPIHGNGVFAATDLPAGKNLVQYRGKLLTHADADERYSDNRETGHTFLFILNDHYVVDANVDGNAARWINHSCAPNCEPVLEASKDGDPKKDRLFIATKRAVKAGEELTYDYGIELEDSDTRRIRQLWACRCGSARCTGTMLKPKKPARKKAQAKKAQAKKAQAKKAAPKKAAKKKATKTRK
ncbi:MAG TPA: SET domain-containing protein-lysine N-methyltransferase [Nevskia sp.]|nr:SET domain-containing protein-lysine N-methyltransferase [Nevskia sp.]